MNIHTLLPRSPHERKHTVECFLTALRHLFLQTPQEQSLKCVRCEWHRGGFPICLVSDRLLGSKPNCSGNVFGNPEEIWVASPGNLKYASCTGILWHE